MQDSIEEAIKTSLACGCHLAMPICSTLSKTNLDTAWPCPPHSLQAICTPGITSSRLHALPAPQKFGNTLHSADLSDEQCGCGLRQH